MAVNPTRDVSVSTVSVEKLEYHIYSGLSEIAGISRQWSDLLAKASCNRAFGSWEWFMASCRMQSSLEPCLATAFLGQELICLLPLALDLKTGTGVFPHLENDYNDALVRDHDPVPLAGLLQYALSGQAPCGQLRLSKLRPDSQCMRAAALLNSSSAVECRSRDMKSYRSIQLPSTFDEYLSSRGKLFRRNARRALRSNNQGEWRICEIYPDDLSPLKLPEVFLQLILDRHGTKCAFHHAPAQLLVREVLPPIFSQGGLRVFAMLNHAKIVAIDLYFSTGDGLVAWNGGFAAEVEHRSPGTTLIAFAIQQAIAGGLNDLDLGEGEESYKQSWSNSSYAIRELDILKR